jgi:hypothetical protein
MDISTNRLLAPAHAAHRIVNRDSQAGTMR